MCLKKVLITFSVVLINCYLYIFIRVFLTFVHSEGNWRDRTPQKVMFVEDLTDIMLENFPDFWKLGQAYFSGEFNCTREVRNDMRGGWIIAVGTDNDYFS